MSNLVLPNYLITNVKMVIFDKDGTLIDVHHYWCSMIKLRAEFFVESLKDEIFDKDALYNDLVGSMGINIKTKKMKPEGPVGIKPRAVIIEVATAVLTKYTNSYSQERVADIFNQVDEYSKLRLQQIVKPLSGVRELLLKLKEAQTLIAIATTDLSNRAIIAMKDLGLADYFCDIAGADLVKNAKPEPDLVEYIISRHNFSMEDVVVIGDSMADLNMAKNAKCKFIGVKSGLYTDEFINNSQYLVDNLIEIGVRR